MNKLRLAEIRDIKELARLFNLYRIFYGKEPDIPGAERFLKERIEKAESRIFVAEEGGRLVGFVQLYPQFSSTRMKRSWLLNDLYVEESYRGLGIGKVLLEAAKELARETASAGIMLETEKTNKIGNELYPSVGFKLYDQNNFYWWDTH